MRIEKGFWIQLVDEYKQRVIYQVSTDTMTEEDFAAIWKITGEQVRRAVLAKGVDGSQIEFRIRVSALS